MVMLTEPRGGIIAPYRRWHLAASSKDLRVMAIGAINRASFAAAAAKAPHPTQAPPSRQLPGIHVASGGGGGTGTTAAAVAAAAARPLGSGPYPPSRRGSQMATAASSMVRGAAVSGRIQASKAIHAYGRSCSLYVSHRAVLQQLPPVLNDDVHPALRRRSWTARAVHETLAEGRGRSSCPPYCRWTSNWHAPARTPFALITRIRTPHTLV